VNRKIIFILLVCVISTIGFTACDAQSDNNSHVPNTVSDTTGTEAEPESSRLKFAAGDSLVAANPEETCETYKKGNLDITWLDLGPDVDFDFDPPILHASEGLFILPLIFKDEISDEKRFAIAIDTGGNIAIGPEYSWIAPFFDGMARVADSPEVDGADSFEGFIDRNGKERISLSNRHFGDFHDDLAVIYPLGSEIMMGQKYMDENGVEVFDISPDVAGDFYEGRAWFHDVNTKLNGYIDRTGAKIIPAIYNATEDFHEGAAFVEKDGKVGYIDKNGEMVIPFVIDNELEWPQFFYVIDHGFYNGLAYVNGGYIDKTGEFVIPEGSFSEGMPFIEKEAAFVVSKTETGDDAMILIDRVGNKLTVPGQYLYCGDSRQDGMIRVARPENETFIGALNPRGEEIIPPDFKVLTEATAGYAMIVTDGEAGKCNVGILKIPN
jgi:hypothetical protein